MVRAAGVLTHLGRPHYRRMPESGAGDDAPSFPARHAATMEWLFSKLGGFGSRRETGREGGRGVLVLLRGMSLWVWTHERAIRDESQVLPHIFLTACVLHQPVI